MKTSPIEDAGFAVWQEMNAATFYVLMAYKHGAREGLVSAREKLALAVSRIDAALVAEKAEAAE